MLLTLAMNVQVTSASVDHIDSSSFLLNSDLASSFLEHPREQCQRHFSQTGDVHDYFSCGPKPKESELEERHRSENETWNPREGPNSSLD